MGLESTGALLLSNSTERDHAQSRPWATSQGPRAKGHEPRAMAVRGEQRLRYGVLLHPSRPAAPARFCRGGKALSGTCSLIEAIRSACWAGPTDGLNSHQTRLPSGSAPICRGRADGWGIESTLHRACSSAILACCLAVTQPGTVMQCRLAHLRHYAMRMGPLQRADTVTCSVYEHLHWLSESSTTRS